MQKKIGRGRQLDEVKSKTKKEIYLG